MEVRTLELNIISAQGLKKVSTFGHDTCYAVAYIYSNEKMATGVDRDGGENPSWNAKVTLSCDDTLLRQGRSFITVQIYNYGSVSNKLVGTAIISLVDVGKQQAGQPQFMAYEVRRSSGKVKGVLNVSIKVGEKRTVEQKKNQSGQAFSDTSLADRKKKSQQDVPPSTGYIQTYPPVQAYPPPTWSSQGGSAAPYPPPTTSYDYAAANNAVSVYPPPKPSSESTGSEASNVGSAYPPPKPSGDSSATGTSDTKKEEEPVLAYPASGIPVAYPPAQYGQQYGGPQYYGSPYAPGPQGYYPAAQPPYNHQQQYQSSRPPKYQGSSSSSGAGLGLLGGLLGGLLIGDVIGDIF